MTLWDSYVFRRGAAAEELWEQMYRERSESGRAVRLLYIAGRGFDTRAQDVMRRFVESLRIAGCTVERAQLVLVGFSGYSMAPDLRDLTAENASELRSMFSTIGSSSELTIDASDSTEADLSTVAALRVGIDKVLGLLTDETDIVLDVSSLPRIAYLSIMLALLERLVSPKDPQPLAAGSICLQVLVGENAGLDAKILSEEPSNDLVLLPGYSLAMHSVAMQNWPMVWFPVLGENRLGQFQRVSTEITELAEVCPVIPHPSRDPRRGDRLLVEYRSALFDTRQTPMSNVLYAHESQPFEAYRQLLTAMDRYQKSFALVGGCRLIVTPLASKLITIGAGLACYEMKTRSTNAPFSVAIPYAEPRRYEVPVTEVRAASAEISALVLTGDAYVAD